MKSQLEELFYAGEGLNGKIGVSQEYNDIYYEFDKVYGQLLKELNYRQKNMLIELTNLAGNMESEAGLTHFKAGFRLCMRLIFEGIGS